MMNEKRYQNALIIALSTGFILLFGWEIYLRSMGIEAFVSDDKHLWAKERSRLHEANNNDIVLIGSSRILFDIQLDVWEKFDGRRPIQLAGAGRGPAAVLIDIVENTDYSGNLIVGCAPGLFFVPKESKAFGWWRGKEWVDHFYNRTYAQRFGLWLDLKIQTRFAFLSGGEEPSDNDYNLETMIHRLRRDHRIEGSVFFPRLSRIDADRNTKMLDIVLTDTAYANQIVRFWMDGPQENPYAKDLSDVLMYYQECIRKFENRGGNIIFLRNPSHGKVRAKESRTHPREFFWDALMNLEGAKGIHFEDHESLRQFVSPELSHLSAYDAEQYTAHVVEIIQENNWLK